MESGSLKHLVKVIEKVERTLSIKRFVAEGVNYWPLIRFQINFYRKYAKWSYKSIYADDALSSFGVAKALVKEYVDFRRSADRKQERLDFEAQSERCEEVNGSYVGLGKKDVVYIAHSKEHYAEAGGLRAAPLIDGIIANNGDSSYFKVIIPARKGESFDDFLIKGRAVDYSAAQKDRFKNPYRQPKTLTKLMSALGVLFRCWCVERKLVGRGYRINPEELLYRLDATIGQKNEFINLLKSLSPEMVFMTSYTGRSFVVAAARELEIPVVDVQHGGMHSYNIACTHWRNVPKDGYQLLPDIFWCWNEEVADMINSTVSRHHHAIAGGNPAYSFWRADNKLLKGVMCDEEKRDISLLKKLDCGKPVAVVALQYGKDDLIDPHVIDVFHETKDEVLWLFRMHPMGKERKDELLEVLGTTDMESMIDWSTRVPVSQLLSHADYVLTKSSTIARESLSFNVTPIFWSQKGAEIHFDLIDQGRAKVALNAHHLRKELLASNQVSQRVEGVAYESSERFDAAMNYLKTYCKEQRS